MLAGEFRPCKIRLFNYLGACGNIMHMKASAREAKNAEASFADSRRSFSSARYLKLLGQRVRDARARHGMSRRMLARDSGISERYLAQLESGSGNFSIVLLRRLAKAIDVPVADLVSDEPERPVEYLLSVERLKRLEDGELAEAADLLRQRFGDRAKRNERIALIGLRGAGKSTLGAALARHLGWRFIEITSEIQSEAGITVNEIFDLWGQAAYRRYERRALERVLQMPPRIVLATGGGIVSEPATFEQLLDGFFTVWVRTTPKEHWDRVIRQGDRRVEGSGDTEALADMRRILAQRDALYGKADARLQTSGKTERESLRDLIRIVQKRS
jgi:XRE family aerobic/anaerobic benzoate catabolism transcriptional regulator